jgi:hypothetical protein
MVKSAFRIPKEYPEKESATWFKRYWPIHLNLQILRSHECQLRISRRKRRKLLIGRMLSHN